MDNGFAGLPWPIVLALGLFTLAGAGGLGGVIATVLKDRRTADVDERSVAITELEKAVPGLGDVIRQLRDQNSAQAEQITRLQDRVESLERELADARGLA